MARIACEADGSTSVLTPQTATRPGRSTTARRAQTLDGLLASQTRDEVVKVHQDA
ncbi:MAG: hypothetical protein ACRDHM_08010 [Actinomycetota bacterium]